jgi:glycosyltransferase involved in cell wall biosynthesis
LAAALSELTNNPQLRRQMGQASRMLVAEKFDIEQHVKALTNIYQDMTAGQAGVASYARG